jgi:hypothetical protein
MVLSAEGAEFQTLHSRSYVFSAAVNVRMLPQALAFCTPLVLATGFKLD